MSKNQIRLYTQPNCGPCSTVKNELTGLKADVVIIDDLLEFPSHIRSVPTLTIEDQTYTGLENILKTLKEIG